MTDKTELSIEDEEELESIGFPLLAQDFDAALKELQKTHCDSIGAPQVSFHSFMNLYDNAGQVYCVMLQCRSRM